MYRSGFHGGVPEVVEIPERLSGAGKLGQRVELFE